MVLIMQARVSDIYISICSAIGISAVLENWNSIINLVLMIVSIINIIFIMVIRIIDAFKANSTKQLEEDTKNYLDQIKKGVDGNEDKRDDK